MARAEIEGLLPRVARPARYTDGEWNVVKKPWERAAVRVLLAYPDLYEVGMSRLGLQVLYDILNRQADVLAERAFSPWLDMEAEMRRQGIPLWGLESGQAASAFDVIAFSLGQELAFPDLLNLLDLAGLPLLAAERPGLPLVIAGGYGLLNPEPLAEFLDAVALGDGEELILDVVGIVRRFKAQGGAKADLLRQLAAVPGLYVPSLYRPLYAPDGRLADIAPLAGLVPPRPEARWLARLPPALARPIVPLMEAAQSRPIIEVQRGGPGVCGLGASGILNGTRLARPAAEVIATARDILANTGYDELALLFARVDEYPEMEGLVEGLRRALPEEVSITVVGMEASPPAVAMAAQLAGRQRRWLSLNPVVGSQGLRRALGQDLSNDDVLKAAESAFAGGWMGLRLHFLIGLPGETEEDTLAIAQLVAEVCDIGRRYQQGRTSVRVNVGSFLPRAQTPFQWARQATAAELKEKQQALAKALRRAGVKPSFEPADQSVLAGVLARGDRRLGAVVRRAWELGARLQGWREQFQWERWQGPFQECGLDPAFYLRERPEDEVLPWSHIDWGFAEGELLAGWRRIRQQLEAWPR